MKRRDDKDRNDGTLAARKQLQSQGQDARKRDDGKYQVYSERSGEPVGRPLTRAELIDRADGNLRDDD